MDRWMKLNLLFFGFRKLSERGVGSGHISNGEPHELSVAKYRPVWLLLITSAFVSQIYPREDLLCCDTLLPLLQLWIEIRPL
ncbi:unnamed protein product [Nippostrongylus brasiliensis]|uniref:Uncharacterized protein n=1 Tax=Nippostrongylus brasiliensis TaxID=27835 RepID=A0A0N4XL40_NIPBR|nr:unnamed protein product [Nippostrongylus brasiliensis]